MFARICLCNINEIALHAKCCAVDSSSLGDSSFGPPRSIMQSEQNFGDPFQMTSQDLCGDFEGSEQFVFDRTSESWTALLKKATEDTSGILKALLEHKDDPEKGVVILQTKDIAAEESQPTLQDCAPFLAQWYMLARKRLVTKGTTAVPVQDIEEHFLMASPEQKFCQKPFPKKYLSLLAVLAEHSGKFPEKHNFHTLFRFFHRDNAADFGIYEDLKSCELNLKIQEETTKMLPDYRALKKIAESEIARYHEKYEGEGFHELKRATAQFSQKISGFHFESDWYQDDKQRKRYSFFKALVEKMNRFLVDANSCRDGSMLFNAIDKANRAFSASLHPPPPATPNPALVFLKIAFNVVSFFFVVINEINTKWPLPITGVARMNAVSWEAKKSELKDIAEELRNLLASTANEAATRWLQSEISGYCYDVCLDTAQVDASTRCSEKFDLPPPQILRATSNATEKGFFTRINRREHLAVDMHAECQDLIGMRVWYLDAVPTGGFNQFFPTTHSSCGVMIVHVFLRCNIAISRLRDHPEKMQAQISSGNNVACGNIQLPSWVQDACVSRLFYQPLLDFLIQDFVLSLHDKQREPVRLVFTGSAFDAVLATVVASELLSRFNSYRLDRFINKCHSHTSVDWDILYNHIRSSVFVLSFMLPAVFSGPHLSPHQESAIMRGNDKDKLLTPHGAMGINMLNISVSNCVAFKIVEHWLSVDRRDLANNAHEWREFSKYDRIVLETLQKLFSCCKKTAQFTKSIEQSAFEVKAWAESIKSPKRATGTFVGDYKGKGSPGKTVMRSMNHPKIAKCQTVQEKIRKHSAMNKMGDAATNAVTAVSGLVHDLQQSADEWWLGCLSLVKDPKQHQLLNCAHKTPSAAHDMMDIVASWFLPVAAVHQVSQPSAFSMPFCHRQAASYGTLNASDLLIPDIAYRAYFGPATTDDVYKTKSVASDSKKPANLCMCSRMSVKPLGSSDSRRLLLHWNCDSTDSHALIRNCFAVTVMVCFDPENASNSYDKFDFQTEEFSSSDLRVTVLEHDYESLYSLQCEAELPVPASCNGVEIGKIISRAVIFVVMRMRFFSAQFGHGLVLSSSSDGKVSRIHNGLGPELFCFPKRLPSKQPDRSDDELTFWFWFYLGRCFSLDGIYLQKFSIDETMKMITQHLTQNFRLHFRKALKLDDFYKKHKFYYDSVPTIENALDFTFCDFEIQDPEEKSYNSRYLHMRLDELIMQAWDFKLLALNAFGQNEDLQNCNFPECDALLQDFDDLCDLIATKFRGSQWSSKLSLRCEACHEIGKDKKRHLCKDHLYDYLNDDGEGLEYVRKQSSYLRRLTFSKSVFHEIVRVFREQQTRPGNPNHRFYQSIMDQIGSISDTHSLMVKLVSCAQEGNPDATMMTQRSYDGIFNAFFVPPIEPRTTLDKGDQRALLPRFPINLYDNEKFELGQQQDYRLFPTALSKEGERAIPACSLVSRRSKNSHHFRSLFRVLETGLQKVGGWHSQRSEAEFTSWAHGMGVLRSFAIRREFEAFCSFFENAKERRSVLSWLRTESESADPYLDCLQQIHQIFEDGSDSSSHLKYARVDYYVFEERIISLICRHDKCGYGSRAVFKKEMMHQEGRKAFEHKVSFLPRVAFLEKLAKFLFFRERNFWASWITNFVCFMSHIHQLREWLMSNKRCVAAFGDQKVGKSRFWSHSLGIETSPSSQSNTVQTQMWMLPYSQFIDFPAFSEENKLGDSYNFDQFVRCDMLARHIVYDFLLVPDICVYIVKTIAPNTLSVNKLIAHIRDLESNRYPAAIATDEESSDIASGGDESQFTRTRSGGGLQIARTSAHNRLARESILLCSHTQNFICRLEPLDLDAVSSFLSFDPQLLSVDMGNWSPEHLEMIGRHADLNKSKFVWVCGGSDGTNDQGHAVKILEKVEVEGSQRWKVVDKQYETWQQLRAKLMKKKQTIGEMFSSKNVFLAYFAEDTTQFLSPYSKDVQNHIEKDFPWSSAFCHSTGNPQNPTPESAGAESSQSDLPILNASQCLALIIKKMFTSDQMQQDKLQGITDKILLRPMAIVEKAEGADQDTEKRICDVCARDVDVDEDERQPAKFVCNECNVFMCEPHAELHRRKKGVHTVERVINRGAEEKRSADFAAALEERDEAERNNPNSYRNRQKRIKIWQFQQQTVVLRGQTSIDELCEDVSHADASQFSCGHINCLLKSLISLQTQLTFESLDVDRAADSLKSMKLNIGIAFWSFLMGDSDESAGPAANVFSEKRITWRTLGTMVQKVQQVPSAALRRVSRSFVDAGLRNPGTPEEVIQQFIADANMLWSEIKDGGGRALKSKIAAMKHAVTADSQETVTAGNVNSNGGVSENLSSAQSSAGRVVPWFSAVFYRMLEEGNCLDFHVAADTGKIPFGDILTQNIISQEFCLALLKIILLPLLASKKCLDLDDIRSLLQYGVGDDFFLSFFYLEKAMLTCMSSEVVVPDLCPLFAWLSIKSSSEDHATRSVEALRLLLRNISLKGLIELECLDFQPCVAVLVCENLSAILYDSRSAFALESSLVCSGPSYSAKEQSLRCLIELTQLAFDRVEQWILKPMRQIEAKIGKDWKSLSKIAPKDHFERVFKISRIVAQQFESVKQRMHKLVDGSYAAVTITVSAELLTELETLADHYYVDIPLMGRTLTGIHNQDTVQCYLTEPTFFFFECKLVCLPLHSTTGTDREIQYLRLPFASMKNMRVHDLAIDGRFTFIISNCSTVFIEELEVRNSDRAILPKYVRWCDLALPESETGMLHPQPLYDCRIELEPIWTSGPANAWDQPSIVQSSGCIVGQRVTMKISFFLAAPVSSPIRIFAVLDDAFDYGPSSKSPTLTILPLKKEAKFWIKEVMTDKGKYRLMEVLFNPESTICEGRITLCVQARNPSGERLCRRACFVYLKHDEFYDDGLVYDRKFDLKAPIDAPNKVCLGCGIARTPEIHNMPLRYCEILVSKPRLGEDHVDLMLAFECSVRFPIFDPNSDKKSVVEIHFPQSWTLIKKDVVRPSVRFLCDTADGGTANVEVELHEFSHSKISIRVGAGARNEGRDSVFLNENSKCTILVRGVALPPSSDELLSSLAIVKEASSRLAEGAQDQSDYEKRKEDVDAATSRLLSLKEHFTSGCNVTIKDGSDSVVMTGRNVSMSPLLEDPEYATVIQRKTFEDSQYKKSLDGPPGQVKWNTSEGTFYTQLEKFMIAFVNQKYCGNAAVVNEDKTEKAINRYIESISNALSAKRLADLTKSIVQQLQNAGQGNVGVVQNDNSNFVSKAAAMAIQLWSSPIALELDNQLFKFYEIMNRHALSADSQELLENGGIQLIKAIKRNIVTDHRDVPAVTVHSSTFVGGAAAEPIPQKMPVRSLEHKLYFRGGSLPFEMAGFFFPERIFRFPVFLATSGQLPIAIGFALKHLQVTNEQERTLWKFSVPPDCKHFKALQENSLLVYEEEFLFPPYSAFRVQSNRREQMQLPSGQLLSFRVICLEALEDNLAPEALNVPTAPRY